MRRIAKLGSLLLVVLWSSLPRNLRRCRHRRRPVVVAIVVVTVFFPHWIAATDLQSLLFVVVALALVWAGVGVVVDVAAVVLALLMPLLLPLRSPPLLPWHRCFRCSCLSADVIAVTTDIAVVGFVGGGLGVGCCCPRTRCRRTARHGKAERPRWERRNKLFRPWPPTGWLPSCSDKWVLASMLAFLLLLTQSMFMPGLVFVSLLRSLWRQRIWTTNPRSLLQSELLVFARAVVAVANATLHSPCGRAHIVDAVIAVVVVVDRWLQEVAGARGWCLAHRKSGRLRGLNLRLHRCGCCCFRGLKLCCRCRLVVADAYRRWRCRNRFP